MLQPSLTAVERTGSGSRGMSSWTKQCNGRSDVICTVSTGTQWKETVEQ